MKQNAQFRYYHSKYAVSVPTDIPLIHFSNFLAEPNKNPNQFFHDLNHHIHGTNHLMVYHDHSVNELYNTDKFDGIAFVSREKILHQ